ncbi:NAD-dependent epimerase/dehydratase family protein [Paenibacillus koleovorans]|uniref:NAD-dependent epimerase/dehydratase family protein n=1 Tax=Paenibacillus koleovorans TaxID=121608 RepID=UPI0013E33501|nr:NAD-dependent epimerase/dehydratase family protein [Paenibacillus koleovorans]
MTIDAQSLFSLEGQVVVVTGGSGYLGTAVTEALVDHGAMVVVADPMPFRGRPSAPERVHYMPCDVSQTESIRERSAWRSSDSAGSTCSSTALHTGPATVSWAL